MTAVITRPVLRELDLAVEVMAHIVTFPTTWWQTRWHGDLFLDNIQEDERFADLVPVSDEDGCKYYTLDELRRFVETPACGTAKCFAGWATQLAGAQPLFQPMDTYRRSLQGWWQGSPRAVLDGEIRSIPELACELLDIDYDAANDMGGLFAGGNTVDELFWILSELYLVDLQELRRRVESRADQLSGIVQ